MSDMGAKGTLYVIDLDRTLVDVDRVMRLSGKVCGRLGIEFSGIKETQLKAAEKGLPYSPLESIEEISNEKLVGFKREFIRLADPGDLIYPDGQRFLNELEKRSEQYMILTYAIDEGWQQLKLEATGLDSVPHIITFQAKKSLDIASWQGSDGLFVPPVEGIDKAGQIIFIDDRLSVFDDLPKNCSGFFLDRRYPQIKVSLPDRVARIDSFDQLIDKI
jgi:hypothetical protein